MSFLNKNQPAKDPDEGFKPASHIKYVIFSIVAILAAGTIVLAYFLIKDRLFKEAPKEQPQESIPALPPNLNDLQGDNIGGNQSGIKAEELLFGNFYNKPSSDFTVGFADYGLPINSKSDALNYYAISRKFDLDSVLNDLNGSGFAIINNPFPAEKDFFSLYQELYKKEIPIFISGDFLFYYFQNGLKSIYKNIEKEIFFNTVWSTSKKLFESAETRYKQKVSQHGQVNDPEVEGSRLVAAYWAVILEILKPGKNQISAAKDISRFAAEEQELYSFSLPDYLKEDVEKEVGLIKLAKENTKSPVKRYKVNYATYEVPENYRRDAKLNNFYQAARWMNSVFPINYISEDCENCLVDKEDWRIKMVAAGLIAGDFARNQEIKNEWAKIYKIISFFSGLRNDLTYLNYDNAMRELFGDNYDSGQIFSAGNENRSRDLENLKNKLAEIRFSPMESGLSRDKEEYRPYLGLRVLQESYWPNEYIFQKLTHPYAGGFIQAKADRNANVTICDTKDKGLGRCRGIALDIINLIYPIKENPYFAENTSYQNYPAQSRELSELLDKFNDNTWHSNSFWVTLSAGKNYLWADAGKMPVFARNQNWENKNINTVIGAWINAQLPGDFLLPSSDSGEAGGFGNISRCNEYNYIEPNLPLIRELHADAEMLYAFFEQLQMYDKQDIIKSDLSEMRDIMGTLENITAKELSGEEISSQEYCYMENVVNDLYVEKAGSKETRTYFDFEGRQTYIKQSLANIKLIIVAHNKGGNLVLSAGPIYAYSESK